MAQTLFVGTPLEVLFDTTNRNIEEDIRKLSDDHVLSRPVEQLANEIAEANRIDVPVLDMARADDLYSYYHFGKNLSAYLATEFSPNAREAGMLARSECPDAPSLPKAIRPSQPKIPV
jgi:hypothetical protein